MRLLRKNWKRLHRLGEQVIVIQHQDERTGAAGDLVEQGCQEDFDGGQVVETGGRQGEACRCPRQPAGELRPGKPESAAASEQSIS